MDFNKFTIKAQEAIQEAQQLAEGLGHGSIDSGHLLKGIFIVDQDVTPYLFNKLSLDAKKIEKIVDKIIESYPKVTGGQLHLSQNANKIVVNAVNEMKAFNDEFVSIEVLLYTMLGINDNIGQLLKDNQINQKNLKEAIMNLRNGQNKTFKS